MGTADVLGKSREEGIQRDAHEESAGRQHCHSVHDLGGRTDSTTTPYSDGHTPTHASASAPTGTQGQSPATVRS